MMNRKYTDWFEIMRVVRRCQEGSGSEFLDGVEREAALAAQGAPTSRDAIDRAEEVLMAFKKTAGPEVKAFNRGTGRMTWWEPAKKPVTLPDYIKGQALGTMRLDEGTVWVKQEGSIVEYVRRQRAM